MSEEKKKIKKRFEGIVVSNKMTNSVVVKVSTRAPHPKYKKILTKSKKFYARALEPLNIGDKVVIEESRPLSKLIHWLVVERKES